MDEHEERERARKSLKRYRIFWWVTFITIPLLYFLLTLMFPE